MADFDVTAFARALVFSPVIFEIRDRGGVNLEDIVKVLAETFKKEYGSYPMRYPMQAIFFECDKLEYKLPLKEVGLHKLDCWQSY